VALKSIVTDLVGTLSASADVLAMAKVEVDKSAIPEGKNLVIKVRRTASHHLYESLTPS
jgi:ubiquinol-cytochrome c reductase iron-sulfur subunit